MFVFKRYLYRNYRVYTGMIHWVGRRMTRGGGLVLGALVFAAAQGDTSLSLTYQPLCFLLFLAIAALASSRVGRSRITAERHLPAMGSVGVPLSYRVVVQHAARRRLRGLTLLEELPDSRPTLQQFLEVAEPGESKRNWLDRTYGYYRWRWLTRMNQRALVPERAVPLIPPGGRTEVRLELVPLRRGVLWFRGVTVAWSDPFGLWRSLMPLPLPQSILILPKRYRISPVALPGTMKYQPGGMALASSVGESEEFVALRDYRPGDSLRHLHWKSWARTGKPIVKEFEDEFFVRHALILDTFADAEFSDRFEEAVSVASSFACTVQMQDSLLDLLFIGPHAYCFRVGRSLAHADQMQEILAAVQVCRDQSFATLRHLVRQHLNAVSGCICIFLAWDDERQELVAELQAQSIPLRVFVVTEAGQGAALDPGPLRGQAGCFHPLEIGRIAETLRAL